MLYKIRLILDGSFCYANYKCQGYRFPLKVSEPGLQYNLMPAALEWDKIARERDRKMRSDMVKKGIERAPHRSLFKAMGYLDREIEGPLVGIANSANEIIPGHIHLDRICDAVKAGVRMGGGTPIEFSTIGICDGIAMGHRGMHSVLASRELIADSIEVMANAHGFDALVLIPNCDKIGHAYGCP
jgi:dihydroxyacid dehydratase/phosphogluconate dehydratase